MGISRPVPYVVAAGRRPTPMRRIAIQSLLRDRGKFLAALAGVAFAASLVLIQVGLYAGFLSMASGIIRRTGGDLWVMPRGIEVIDNSEPLSGAARAVALAHPCVRRVRGMIYSFVPVRKPRGTPDAVTLVGYEPGDDPIVPWTLDQGLPHDLHGHLRAAVDRVDLRKLQIEGEALGSLLPVNGHTVRVAATTEGMRSFTLVPFPLHGDRERPACGPPQRRPGELLDRRPPRPALRRRRGRPHRASRRPPGHRHPALRRAHGEPLGAGVGSGIGAGLHRAPRARGGRGDRRPDPLRGDPRAPEGARDAQGHRRDRRGEGAPGCARCPRAR